MPQPKKRMSHTRSGNRRSHIQLNTTAVSTCSHCHHPILSHTVCNNCGYYRGKLVKPQKTNAK